MIPYQLTLWSRLSVWAALLACSSVLFHHLYTLKIKATLSLSVHRFLSCSLFRSFRSVVRHVNSLGKKNNGRRRQHSVCHILIAGSFIWETCTKQLHLKSWITCLRKAATWTDVQHSYAQFYMIAALQEVRLLSPNPFWGHVLPSKCWHGRSRQGRSMKAVGKPAHFNRYLSFWGKVEGKPRRSRFSLL